MAEIDRPAEDRRDAQYLDPITVAVLLRKLRLLLFRFEPDADGVHRAADALNARNKALKGSRILILGLAYKPNVDDERESPSYVLMSLLNERGAEVEYHDPYVPVIKQTREHSQFVGKKSVAWDQTTIQNFDLVLIATNHSCVNYQELGDWAQCIIDTRNAMASVKVAAGKVWKA